MRRLVTPIVAAVGLAFAADGHRRVGAPGLAAQYLLVDGLSLRATVAGSGSPTVILLHGFGESLVAWRPVFDQLRSEFRVAAIDLPGHGLSAKPATGYHLDSVGALVAGAIRLVAPGQVVLVGHSMGGAVAAWVALTEPSLVAGLVLVDAAGLPGPVLSQLHELPPGTAAGVIGLTAAFRSPHDPAWLAESDSALGYEPSADEDYYEALEAVWREFEFTALDAALHRVRPPTLVVWGRHDRTTPLENGERFAREIPGARLVIIEGALHRPHVTHPGRVAAAIAGFVAGRPPSHH